MYEAGLDLHVARSIPGSSNRTAGVANEHGQTRFAQVMAHLPLNTFRRCVARYDGEHKVKHYSFERHRCLIPANGFYEWQAVNEDGKLGKQPWYVCPANDGEFFAMAGLLAAWQSPEGQDIVTACVITTTSNEVMAPIHDRMPVLLQPEHFDAWLDPARRDVGALSQCLLPAPAAGMVA